MGLVDANLLLFAYNASSEEHLEARRWVAEVFSGSEPVALSWPMILAFIRVSTNPRAFPKPLSRVEAMGYVSEWIERPQTVVIVPGENQWDILQPVSLQGKVTGFLFSDAHLAALAIEHGATLHTIDRNFASFPKLKFENPLKRN